MGKYRKHSPETKVKIVLEILRGEKSLAQASREYQIKDSLLYRWKDQFLEGAKQAFAYGQPAEQKRRADFIYLAVVMDVYTRAVRGWHLSWSSDKRLTLPRCRNADQHVSRRRAERKRLCRAADPHDQGGGRVSKRLSGHGRSARAA